MTITDKLYPEDKRSWDEALALHREQLRFYLNYLVQCDCSHQVLANVEVEVQKRFVSNDFKFRFLVRTLVQHVIEHLRESTHQRDNSQSSANDPSNSAADTPVQERLVYFMRDVLKYSTRDTSLLIGITDTQVESLLSFARERIDMTEGPSSMKVEAPGCVPRVQRNLRCHVSGSENSRTPGNRKFRLKEGIKSLARKFLMFLSNLVRSSYVEFQVIVTGGVEHMDH